MINQFSQKTREALQAYVYFLRDPAKNEIFYIGKGRGDRVFQHVNCAISRPKVSDKLDRIREIGSDRVEHVILRHGMKDETALELEAALIDFLRTGDGQIKGSLTNEQSGHDSTERGGMTVHEVEAQYVARKLEPQHPVILININKRYLEAKTGMHVNAEKLYEITRGSWRIGVRRENAEYALATYKGLVREVYQIEGWEPKGPHRWSFIGKVAAPEIKAMYSMTSYGNFIKNGATNPIRYAGFDQLRPS